MHDKIFAQSLVGRNVVLGYYFKAKLQEDESGITGLLPPALTKMDVQWSERLPIHEAVGFGGNLEILQTSAPSGGYFDNPFVDSDGVFVYSRRAAPFGFNGAYWYLKAIYSF